MSGETSRLIIRPGALEDAPAIGFLIDAMDTHYRGPGGGSGLEASQVMAARAIEAREGTRFLLAFEHGAPVGIACFAIVRPGRRLAGLVFLKDLFVRANWRGTGLGKALMAELARIATSEGIARIDWTASREDTGLHRFYEALGGNVLSDRLFFRLNGEALKDLASAKRGTT